jgi:ATP-dependent DNA helicase RecG
VYESAGNIIADIAHKDGSLKASRRGTLKSRLENGVQSTPESTPESALESALQIVPRSVPEIIVLINNNSRITMTEIANQTGYSRRWVAKIIKKLQEQNVIKRIGSNKSGYWEIL